MRDYQPELKALIASGSLTRRQAADLMRVSPHTVNAYLRPRDNRAACAVPLNAVELLAYKLRWPTPQIEGMA